MAPCCLHLTNSLFSSVLRNQAWPSLLSLGCRCSWSLSESVWDVAEDVAAPLQVVWLWTLPPQGAQFWRARFWSPFDRYRSGYRLGSQRGHLSSSWLELIQDLWMVLQAECWRGDILVYQQAGWEVEHCFDLQHVELWLFCPKTLFFFYERNFLKIERLSFVFCLTAPLFALRLTHALAC